jgi:tetratricopeptide (TPR) repeat protein
VKPAAIAEAHYNIARAQCEADPASAIPHFREARTLNPEQYGAAVDLSLVHCYFKMKDADKLREALVVLERNNSSSYNALPPAVPRWCGWMCFQSKRYLDADKYLSDAVARASREKYTAADGTQKERAAVEPLVWKTLARARLELRQYERGLEAAEHYVSMETQPYRKAEGMRDNALLLIGLMRTAEARKLCESAIALGIDGPIKSTLFITLGDAYYIDREYGEAAKYYGRTANVVSDKELKPLALYKITCALKRCGKEGEASQYEQALRTELPDWVPNGNVQHLMDSPDSAPKP